MTKVTGREDTRKRTSSEETNPFWSVLTMGRGIHTTSHFTRVYAPFDLATPGDKYACKMIGKYVS